MQEIPAKLFELCKRIEPVGSRVTCDPPVIDSDDDRLCLVEHLVDFCVAAEAEGFELGGSTWEDDRSDFKSMTLGDLNIIATSSIAFFDRFMLATRVAKRMNVLDKECRIVLFQAVLYGSG